MDRPFSLGAGRPPRIRIEIVTNGPPIVLAVCREEGHKPSLSNMDFVYGTRPWEETLALQLSYLPDGPLGLFATVRPAGSEGIPPELERLYAKLKSKEIDAQDFARKAKELAWGSSPELAKP